MEGRLKGFPYRHDSGRRLPTHRSPGRLHPGVPDYGGDLGNHSLRSGSRPGQSHRKNGVRGQIRYATKDRIAEMTPGYRVMRRGLFAAGMLEVEHQLKDRRPTRET